MPGRLTLVSMSQTWAGSQAKHDPFEEYQKHVAIKDSRRARLSIDFRGG